mgnify:CR=1 FL=1
MKPFTSRYLLLAAFSLLLGACQSTPPAAPEAPDPRAAAIAQLEQNLASSELATAEDQLAALQAQSPNDPTLAIEALSGGNQQKVVVGRWLDSGRRLLITEDPTAGVDVGAKAEIYHLLYQALASGMGVLVVSTDFEEIANICHRAIVFSRGLPVAELSGALLSTESLIQAASAGEAA